MLYDCLIRKKTLKEINPEGDFSGIPEAATHNMVVECFPAEIKHAFPPHKRNSEKYKVVQIDLTEDDVDKIRKRRFVYNDKNPPTILEAPAEKVELSEKEIELIKTKDVDKDGNPIWIEKKKEVIIEEPKEEGIIGKILNLF